MRRLRKDATSAKTVGGFHDAPNPGELLCAALAACHDATVRMVANLLGIDILDRSLEVTGTLDVRAHSSWTAPCRSSASSR